MKKILLTIAMCYCCTGVFAIENKTNNGGNVLCTVVCSPCPEVPNTTYEGQATDDQIRNAQEKMRKECEKIHNNM